jgi:hypothetical protein
MIVIMSKMICGRDVARRQRQSQQRHRQPYDGPCGHVQERGQEDVSAAEIRHVSE